MTRDANTEYFERLAEVSQIIDRLKEHCDLMEGREDAGEMKAIDWGDVGVMGFALTHLREVSDFVFNEGEAERRR